MLTLLLVAVFFVCVAMLWNEGMWSNALALVNVVLAGLVATNYFEPAAEAMDRQMPSYTYLWGFLMLWGLFAATYLVLRTVTDLISRQRVRFKMPVEHTGRVLFAVWVGWIMVGFTTMSLHVAPLGPESFGGEFQRKPEGKKSNNFLGMAPDRQWLAFVQKCSRGALCRSDDRASSPHAEDQGMRVFDPKSDFIMKYHTRRANFAKEPEYRVRRD